MSMLEWAIINRALAVQAEAAQASIDKQQKVEPTLRATEIAAKAAELVGGQRDRQHGQKRDNFTRIAAVWNAWLAIRRDPAAPLDAHDVGMMMAFMKGARTQSGAVNTDDYIDMAGYAACAGEVAQPDENSA